MSNWRDFLASLCILASVIFLSIYVYFYSKDVCPVGTMQCGSESICIPQKSVCNGQHDCPGEEDEDTILCADLHGSTHLIEVTLNRSYEEQRTNTAYSCDIENYPSICICGYGTRVYCNHAQFTEIPQNISTGVTYLGLQNNSISWLGLNSLERYNLTLLYLEDNNISYLAPNAFQHQHYLEKLFLMNNDLSCLDPGVFNGLFNLQWLHLDNNNLENLDLAIFETIKEVQWLILSYNKIDFKENDTFPDLPLLLELSLNNNKIKLIGNNIFTGLTQLRVLNLGSNLIQVVKSEAFRNLKQLEELDLYGNQLQILSENLFVSQDQLLKLFLGKNPVKYLPKELFSNNKKLASLNLEEIEITNIDTSMFKDLVNLKAIYLKSYKYCAYAATVPRCTPSSDGISSTMQLLFKPIFRYSIWIMSFITIAGNTLVLFGRFLFKDKNKNLSIVIKHLAVSDLLMGIYLFIIAYHDLKFRDNYNKAARKWISSWNCTLTGILGMTSLEVSVLVLVFISVDRYFVITMPYRKFGGLNLKDTWRVLLCIWCFGISISVLPALGFMSSTKFYGVNGLCLPLYIDDPYLVGWEYSALIFFGINAPGLLIIVYVYGGMFINIKQTRNAASLPMDDYQFVIKFIFIVLANIACWLPIIVAKVIVCFDVDVSADVYGWLTVFVLPINSSLNPILYTFTTRKYRTKIVRVPSCIKNLANLLHSNSNSTKETNQASGTIFSIATKNIKS